MNWKIAVLLFVLIDFAVLSLWAIYEVGYLGIFAMGFSGPGAMQVLADLVIVCALACFWMITDARRTGLNAWPYAAITVAAGAFGPLLYLVRRQWHVA